ncbi:DUF1800 domain-containing protein [Rubellicoccus peritrichatus]|uniref:DUF1800 family protein n=1 Tax=Rubellicoccus peritrichatus TaxID=3080537 RepID=A0AAQ3QV39_9BACT|nr:DUF1800 family protein [Puniceicoccus sp. CR14]WOO41118.1 DUF1800 family protein [Puniceicoccus sp. CR14]
MKNLLKFLSPFRASHILILIIGLCFLSPLFSQERTPVIEGSSSLQNNWWYSSWLGSYSQPEANNNWIYSQGLGWMYAVSTGNNNIWFYHAGFRSWLWTNAATYPFVYHTINGWVYFAVETDFTYYFITRTGQWLLYDRSVMDPALDNLQRTSRFLAQSTLGVDMQTIQSAASKGINVWLEEQFNLPVISIREYIERRHVMSEEGLSSPDTFRQGWWNVVYPAKDMLRHRVALALSEIFVVSDRLDNLEDSPLGMASYYDMLQRNAFGNYRQLLEDVTYHPAMGAYLSHVGNRKADPQTGRFPDENYAREVMQLFTIGLFELNPDGTQRLNASGQPIPTYGNEEITAFARVFTGMNYDIRSELIEIQGNFEEFLEVVKEFEMEGVPPMQFDSPPTLETIPFEAIYGYEMFNYVDPMILFDREHDKEEKRLLNGVALPANQNIQKDISDALDNLFNHPNTGPFISRLLIQRLVKSNPSPAYIKRVADVFANNGKGVRGDMKAIIEAILLDPEAMSLDLLNDPSQGKMREPYFRFVTYLKAFNGQPGGSDYFIDDVGFSEAFLQRPLSSPSVFNFFLPDYSPLGAVSEAGLFAPEFQITNSYTLTEIADVMYGVIVEDFIQELEPEDATRLGIDNWTWSVDLSQEIALVDNPRALLDRLDTLLTYGTLSSSTRQIVESSLTRMSNEGISAEERVRFAIYLIFVSPDFVISH